MNEFFAMLEGAITKLYNLIAGIFAAVENIGKAA